MARCFKLIPILDLRPTNIVVRLVSQHERVWPEKRPNLMR